MISAEIHQFVNEFETKRAKREGKNLDATLAIAKQMETSDLPNTSLLLGDNIPKLVASLEVGFFFR